jgi:hypothetical protein
MSALRTPVVAKNRDQYEHWLQVTQAREPRMAPFTYVGSPLAARGLLHYGVIVVGTFWERPDAQGIWDALQAGLHINFQHSESDHA